MLFRNSHYPLLLLIALSISQVNHAQSNWKDTLLQTQQKLISIQSGYYEVKREIKSWGSNDTLVSFYKTNFKKVKRDKNLPFHFASMGFINDTVRFYDWYNGDTLIRANQRSKKATYYLKKEHKRDIWISRFDLVLFKPLLMPKADPFSSLKGKRKSYNDQYLILDSSEYRGKSCWNIQVRREFIKRKDNINYPLKTTYIFWIDRETHLPLKYSEEYAYVYGQDTQTNFEQFEIIKLKASKKNSGETFTHSSKIKDYQFFKFQPYKAPKLLPSQADAPLFTLKSIEGDSVSLSALKGKIVILDFYFMRCYPCVKAMPQLQKLHEKYEGDSLQILGINSIDQDSIELKEFLQNQGVSYINLLATRDLTRNKYNVVAYPTLYVINREGKIVYSQVGYHSEMYTELERLLLELF